MTYRTFLPSALAAAICLTTLAVSFPQEAAAQGIQVRVGNRGYSNGGYSRGYRSGYGNYRATRSRSSSYGYSRYGNGRYGTNYYGYGSPRYGYPSSVGYGTRRGASINLNFGGSRSYGYGRAYSPYGYRNY